MVIPSDWEQPCQHVRSPPKICKPSVIPYSAANASVFFKRFLLAAFLISVAAVWYVVYNVQPSPSCGPFRGVSQCGGGGEDGVCGVYDYIIDIILDTPFYALKDV